MRPGFRARSCPFPGVGPEAGRLLSLGVLSCKLEHNAHHEWLVEASETVPDTQDGSVRWSPSVLFFGVTPIRGLQPVALHRVWPSEERPTGRRIRAVHMSRWCELQRRWLRALPEPEAQSVRGAQGPATAASAIHREPCEAWLPLPQPGDTGVEMKWKCVRAAGPWLSARAALRSRGLSSLRRSRPPTWLTPRRSQGLSRVPHKSQRALSCHGLAWGLYCSCLTGRGGAWTSARVGRLPELHR